MTLDWKAVFPKGSIAVRVSREDLRKPFVDFTTNYKEALGFKKRFKGGALNSNIIQMIKKIEGFGINLIKSQKDLLKGLKKWAWDKSSHASVLLKIKCSSKSLEGAKFQNYAHGAKRYWASPYGSFEHFKKVVNKYGFERYEPYLKGKRGAHVRVVDKIPKGEIEVMR